MKYTKLSALSALALAGSFALTACGGGTETTTLTKDDQPGVSETITLESNGDEVKTQSVEVVVNYEEAGMVDKETAKEAMDNMGLPDYDDIEGVDYDVEFGDEEITETTKIDYDKVDKEELSSTEGWTGDDLSNADTVSLEETTKNLEGAGYEKQED